MIYSLPSSYFDVSILHQHRLGEPAVEVPQPLGEVESEHQQKDAREDRQWRVPARHEDVDAKMSRVRKRVK